MWTVLQRPEVVYEGGHLSQVRFSFFLMYSKRVLVCFVFVFFDCRDNGKTKGLHDRLIVLFYLFCVRLSVL